MISRTLAHTVLVAATGALLLTSPVAAQQSRDQIRIVGSSTVFPFSTVVAENFGKLGKFKVPVVESTGTGGGFKAFCAGVGPQHADISNASRPITAAERENCARNGVTDIAELSFGYDGIAFAVHAKGKAFPITLRQAWLALAAEVPVGGKLVPNPYMKWSDVAPGLPAITIEVYGPSKNHGTRDAFNELVMEVGCKGIPEIAALAKDAQKKACMAMREDGAWVDVSEDYALIVGKLNASPSAVGVITFSYIDQNRDKLAALPVDGVAATFENIAAKTYPVSRPLFFYVKRAHLGIVPGLADYAREFLATKSAGQEGYLVDKGLIPLPAAELKAQQAVAASLK